MNTLHDLAPRVAPSRRVALGHLAAAVLTPGLAGMAGMARAAGAPSAVPAQAAPPAVAEVAPPYVLENTEVLTVTSATLQRRYPLYVSLPADHARTAQRYPVVYVTDAPYAFPLVRAIAGRVQRHGQAGLQPFILVGLGYAVGDEATVSRNRDYTPSDRLRDGKGEPQAYGQGAAYLAHLADEVLPLIDRRYRTDPTRRVYVGHSYGALLGLQALLTRPAMFSHHVLGSPSLWFNREQPFEALQGALPRAGWQGRVRFYVGGLERPGPRRPRDEDMVGQLQRYAAQLRQRGGSRLDLQAQVLDGEDHATVFPRLVTQGLLWALPAPR